MIDSPPTCASGSAHSQRSSRSTPSATPEPRALHRRLPYVELHGPWRGGRAGGVDHDGSSVEVVTAGERERARLGSLAAAARPPTRRRPRRSARARARPGADRRARRRPRAAGTRAAPARSPDRPAARSPRAIPDGAARAPARPPPKRAAACSSRVGPAPRGRVKRDAFCRSRRSGASQPSLDLHAAQASLRAVSAAWIPAQPPADGEYTDIRYEKSALADQGSPRSRSTARRSETRFARGP